MTIKEYIVGKFRAFGDISDAQMLDIERYADNKFSVEEDYTLAVANDVDDAIIDFLEEMLFAPKLKSVSEQGFSMSWDTDDLEKWYLWLCRRRKRKPSDDIIAMLGIPTITDRTHIW